MKKYVKGGVTTDQIGFLELIKEDFYGNGRKDIEFRKVWHGGMKFDAHDRKRHSQRFSMQVAALLIEELVDALIEKNCLFKFPVGKIYLSIRNISKYQRSYRPCLDLIFVPPLWIAKLKRMQKNGQFIMIKFTRIKLARMMDLILRHHKRYREKTDNNGV